MSPTDAPNALTRIEKADLIRYLKLCGILTVAWIILGFVSRFFWSDHSVVLWQVGCSLGWLANMAVVAHPRATSAPRWALGLRYADCAAVLFIYVLLWVFLLSSEAPSCFDAYIGTMLGCIYVLGGISGRGFRSINGISDCSLIGLGAVFTAFSFLASALPSGWFAPICLAFCVLGQLPLGLFYLRTVGTQGRS